MSFSLKTVILFVLIFVVAIIATLFDFYVNAINRLNCFNCTLAIVLHEAETCNYICKIKKFVLLINNNMGMC